jgi:PPOX class probable F420-dependent enzyme
MMDVADALDFIRRNHLGVLGTTREDGRPQMSPVAASVIDGGKVAVSTREGAMKTANLRRRPYGYLVIFSAGFYGPWVQVEGPVEVVSLPDAMDGLIAVGRDLANLGRNWHQYFDDPAKGPEWADFREAMTRQRRVLLAMDVVGAGPDQSG